MKKDLGKKEKDVEVDDSIEQQDSGPRGGNSDIKKVSKNNIKLIAALFLLFVLILMGIAHAHFIATIVIGITVGVLIVLIDKDKMKT